METSGEPDALTRSPALRRVTIAGVCAIAAAPVALLAAVAPAAGFAVAGLAAGFAVARRNRERLLDPASPFVRSATVVLLAAAIAGFAVGVVGVGLVVANWPATMAVATLVGGVLFLAWRAPAWALLGGLLLVGFEGSIKILLGFEPTPLPGDERAAGAAAIDLALFGAVAGVLVADRLETPRAIWAQATKGERVALRLLGVWLALSVLQIAQNENLVNGVEGFRLFQAYTAVAVAVAVAAWSPRVRRHALPALLAVTVVVGLYAALRVAIGEAHAEFLFAAQVRTTSFYGGQLRALGSFSSSIGMVSFLTPVAIAGLVAGYLSPRMRLVGWAAAALAIVGILGSYGRGPLFGILVGLLFALVVLVGAGDVSRRRKAIAGALVLATVGMTYLGVQVASRGSDRLQERARGVLNPGQDKSVKLRFDNWRDRLEDVRSHPFGHGVGWVGGASANANGDEVTTDNSFLKVLVEQGVYGLVIFLAGLVMALWAVTRRLAARGGEARAAGLAALAGVVGFLVLSISGEYVEQPGKVVAWALLGIATACAFAPGRDAREAEA